MSQSRIVSVADATSLHPFWRGLGSAVYYFGRVATPRVNWLSTSRPLYDISDPSQPAAILAVLAYCAVVLTLGTIAFSRREL